MDHHNHIVSESSGYSDLVPDHQVQVRAQGLCGQSARAARTKCTLLVHPLHTLYHTPVTIVARTPHGKPTALQY